MKTLTDPGLTQEIEIEPKRKNLALDPTTLIGYSLLVFSAGLYGLEEYYKCFIRPGGTAMVKLQPLVNWIGGC